MKLFVKTIISLEILLVGMALDCATIKMTAFAVEEIKEADHSSSALDSGMFMLEEQRNLYISEPIKENEIDGFSTNNLSIVAPVVSEAITALAVDQNLFLGMDRNKIDYTNFVKEVKIGGRLLSTTEYTVSAITPILTDVIGKKMSKIRVVSSLDNLNYVDIDVPVTISWGNAIRLKGAYHQTISGLSLLKKESAFQIKATRGLDDRTVNDINKKFNPYMKISHYQQPLGNLESEIPQFKKEINGADSIESFQTSIGNFSAMQGDVIGIYHEEILEYPQMIDLYSNNVERTPYSENVLHSKKSYYEVSNEGYRFLYLNQLKPTKKEILFGMSRQQLDLELQSYLSVGDYQNIKVKKFVTYPDTSRVAETSAVIQVEETLSTGNKITYDYTVLFDVSDLISAVPVSQNIALGTDFATLNYMDFVKDVKRGSQALEPRDYTVTVLNGISTNEVRAQTSKVKIALKSNPASFIEMDVPVSIVWGNTIRLKGSEFQTISGLSLVKDASTIQIKATRGLNDKKVNDINKKFNPYMIISHYQQPRGDLKNWDNRFRREINGAHTVESFQTTVGSFPVLIGDVLGVRHKEVLQYPKMLDLYSSNIPSTPYGDNKFNSVDSYYEITNNGYRVLYFNQLLPTEQKIFAKTTTQQLDLAVKKYLSVENYPKLVVKKFITYPDTSKVGKTTGIIQLEETLEIGEKITYEYEVPFNVDIDVESPVGKPKLTVIDLNDTDKILNAPDYKAFLSEYSDNGTPSGDLEAKLVTTEAELKRKISSVQATSFKIKLEDRSQNSVIIEIPIFVKDKETIVSNDRRSAIRAENIILSAEEYPTTELALDTFVRTKSKLMIWQLYEDKVGEKLEVKDVTFSQIGLPLPGSLPKESESELLLTYNKNNLLIEKNILLTITGALRFKKVPANVEFKDVEIQNKTQYVERKDSQWQIEIQNTLSATWTLKARATPLADAKGNQIPNSIVYKNKNGQEMLVNLISEEIVRGSKDETSSIVSWSDNEGILLKIPVTAKIGEYSSTITWTLESVP